MAAYRRVDDLRSPAGWLPVHRDQLRAQRSVSTMGSLYLYLLPSGAPPLDSAGAWPWTTHSVLPFSHTVLDRPPLVDWRTERRPCGQPLILPLVTPSRSSCSTQDSRRRRRRSVIDSTVDLRDFPNRRARRSRRQLDLPRTTSPCRAIGVTVKEKKHLRNDSSKSNRLLDKRSFYRSFNAIFEKVERIASNEVIIQLIKTKCSPVIYYGLEACPLRKSQYNSMDYVINSSFRKVFDIKSQEVIGVCLGMFNCLLHSRLLP